MKGDGVLHLVTVPAVIGGAKTVGGQTCRVFVWEFLLLHAERILISEQLTQLWRQMRKGLFFKGNRGFTET